MIIFKIFFYICEVLVVFTPLNATKICLTLGIKGFLSFFFVAFRGIFVAFRFCGRRGKVTLALLSQWIRSYFESATNFGYMWS